MASGEMSDGEFLEFNAAWVGASKPYLCEGGVFGTFIDWRGFPAVHAAAVRAELRPLNLVVWAKTNAGMGSLYRSQLELLPLFKKGGAPHVNNVYLGKRGRHPFLGSGSTLIAPQKSGRLCRGVELDPLYVNVVVRRYEAATGQAALLVATGETFVELASRRAVEGM
jgi:hypothetical protein